jgi:hypothetical protein
VSAAICRRVVAAIFGIGGASTIFFCYGSLRAAEYGFAARFLLVGLVTIVPICGVLPLFGAVAYVGLILWRGDDFGLPSPDLSAPRCVACGYPAEGLVKEACPECGGREFACFRRWPFRVMRPAFWAGLLGIVVGVVFAEFWAAMDEATFRKEAAAHAPGPWGRPRWWPFSSCHLVINEGQIHAND